MTLGDWIKEDARRSYVVYYSRSRGDYTCLIRDPAGSPNEYEIPGDTEREAVENACGRLGLTQ